MRRLFAWRAEYESIEARAAAAELRVAELEAITTFLREQAIQERSERLAESSAASARYEALLARYHEAVTPAILPQSGMVAGPVLHKEPDEIAKVIREQSEGNIALANHLRRYARSLKDQGLSQDAIVGKLVAWTSTEDTGNDKSEAV